MFTTSQRPRWGKKVLSIVPLYCLLAALATEFPPHFHLICLSFSTSLPLQSKTHQNFCSFPHLTFNIQLFSGICQMTISSTDPTNPSLVTSLTVPRSCFTHVSNRNPSIQASTGIASSLADLVCV
ncbi:hypothetical protein BJ875DRAFT_459262 [Amylocarpus encephaloides]|uniref:Uncharacterized protein n=1 Tax=Amylocarpus encephaloides TaxID=45428 RepID=A0A9P7YKR0_9HELO|nr:hypothetical protein BJ875DRAFT_459262 [Amylocarpus encephaloides]